MLTETNTFYIHFYILFIKFIFIKFIFYIYLYIHFLYSLYSFLYSLEYGNILDIMKDITNITILMLYCLLNYQNTNKYIKI